jgi:primase-polymerase (primpol)-like protein
VGFALGPDGNGGCWQGIDLDHLSEHPELQTLVERLPGYVERSPSVDGVHAIGYGQSFETLSQNGSGIEAYSERRFFTVTGDAWGCQT